MPALLRWLEDGTEEARHYYQQDQLQDPAPGVAALQGLHRHVTKAHEWRQAHFQRDVLVPNDFHTWNMEKALRCDLIEIRTLWFEINGWHHLEKKLKLVSKAPDPANPGHTIRLYRFPRRLDPYQNRGRTRLIICDNASLDLDGSRRTYALPVPKAWGNDALAVMARSYGLTRKEYEQVAVAK